MENSIGYIVYSEERKDKEGCKVQVARYKIQKQSAGQLVVGRI